MSYASHTARVLKFILKYILAPGIVIGASMLSGIYFAVSMGKDFSSNSNWFDNGRGVDEAFYQEINGVDHFIRIRGRDMSNPVMVVLHGGPGTSAIPFTHRAYRPVAEYFTVVDWDQRGTSKSRRAPLESMTYEQLVQDSIEVIELARRRFGVKKVTLVGHSWGSMLGLGVIQARPDLIAAYVGVGQGLGTTVTIEETRRLAMEAARAGQDEQTLVELADTSDDWADTDDVQVIRDQIAAVQMPIARHGGSIYALKEHNVFRSTAMVDFLLSPDLSISELFRMLLTDSDDNDALMLNIHNCDWREEFGSSYAVPMFIFQGEHDWQTPVTLVKPWFAGVSAPYKEYIAFEDSAHLVYDEQPGKFLLSLLTRVRPIALEFTQSPDSL